MSHRVSISLISLLSCAFSAYAQNASGSHCLITINNQLKWRIFFLINEAADRELALHLGESVPLFITLLQISSPTAWKQLNLTLPWFPTKKTECDEDVRSFRLEIAAVRPLKSLSHAEQAVLISWILPSPTPMASPPGTPFTWPWSIYSVRSESWIWS